MVEKHDASENMKKFFANLLEIKAYINKRAEETKNKDLQEIYTRLDKIIKNEDET